MAKIINNSGAPLTTKHFTIKDGEIADLEGKELETVLKLKGVSLLEAKEAKQSKKDK